MSAAFIIAGVLVGALVARVSPAEPLWGLLIIPAAAAFVAGCVLKTERR